MMLRQSQLALGEVSEAYSLKQDKGMVLAQYPKAEASVGRDAPINLVISGGAPPAGVALMPDFLRKSLDEVRVWAAGAGAKIEIKTDNTSLFPRGTVMTQTPTPDTVLSPDAKVSLLVSGRKGAAPTVATEIFTYELPQSGSESQVRIVVIDKYGERELFNGVRKPGTKVEVPVSETGGARVKIYMNGILVEERDL